jgi:hypothetical protein
VPIRYFNTGKETLLELLNLTATAALQTLLEEKHLYQSVSFDPTTFAKNIEAEMVDGDKPEFTKFVGNLVSEIFGFEVHGVPPAKNVPLPNLRFTLPNPSLYCKKCKRRETFNPVWFRDAAMELHLQNVHATVHVPPPVGFQMFFLVFQCNRCKGTPEGFLVRRHNWKFILEGRSPIEHLEVPDFIPENENTHYSNALLAHNSGKTLAALLYLRTFIEQFARRVTGIGATKKRGEDIFAAYLITLPSPHKETMPVLGEWYEKLSIPIHLGQDDDETFTKAKSEIDKHFKIRKVYTMSEEPPAKKNDGAAPG